MAMSAAVANDNWLDAPDPTKKLLRISEVSEMVGLSRSMIYKCMKDPAIAFPSPVKIGVLSRWDQNEIFAWADAIKKRI
jgi:predicted DNA-binding transcriptional regulator AlpA